MTKLNAALPASLVLVGAGRMGAAMMQGWLAMGLPAASLTILDPVPAPDLAAACADRGVRLNPPLAEIPAPDVLVLAIKPQMLDTAAPGLAPLAGPDTLILSILAGKRIADLSGRFPAAGAIVRAMPNTPAAIGRGISGVAASPAVSERQRGFAAALLGAVGQVEWLADESLIDAVTAVSGSGPAYVFLLAESLARAGEAAGLPADLALRLARATVEGSGELMRQSPDVAPATLRQNVTS
ncbi:MAG: pyrroline-5-carboxylate reductase, partial [Methylobacterium sp.]|uniref:pyrroline-5-carboxylate reductase n=1 Tax=Methylobacterium sp. TaxID=409 RepID=UPI002723C4FB